MEIIIRNPIRFLNVIVKELALHLNFFNFIMRIPNLGSHRPRTIFVYLIFFSVVSEFHIIHHNNAQRNVKYHWPYSNSNNFFYFKYLLIFNTFLTPVNAVRTKLSNNVCI